MESGPTVNTMRGLGVAFNTTAIYRFHSIRSAVQIQCKREPVG